MSYAAVLTGIKRIVSLSNQEMVPKNFSDIERVDNLKKAKRNLKNIFSIFFGVLLFSLITGIFFLVGFQIEWFFAYILCMFLIIVLSSGIPQMYLLRKSIKKFG
jgi:hypothetical protein